MCHGPAMLYNIVKRGFIRVGYHADLTVVRKVSPYTIQSKEVRSKCGWTPLEGRQMSNKVEKTFVNGILAYDSGEITTEVKGQELQFSH